MYNHRNETLFVFRFRAPILRFGEPGSRGFYDGSIVVPECHNEWEDWDCNVALQKTGMYRTYTTTKIHTSNTSHLKKVMGFKHTRYLQVVLKLPCHSSLLRGLWPRGGKPPCKPMCDCKIVHEIISLQVRRFSKTWSFAKD